MKISSILLAAAALFGFAVPAQADPRPPTASALFAQLAPSSARDDVREGRRLSLGEIYQRLRARFGGDAVDVLEDRGDSYVIRWKTRDGDVRDVVVDARSGQVLR
jgi:hypothetical protein